MRRVDEVQAGDPDAPHPGRIVRAAVLIGLLGLAGCGSDGFGSVDIQSAPDVRKIGASPKSAPTPGARTKPTRAPSKKPVQVFPG